MDHTPLADRVIASADRCVACGLCLPHCPTYRSDRDENESPRGRIALLRAYAQGVLPPSPALRGHIARCLGCQACEAVCPSRVPYGRLLEDGRALLVHHTRPWLYHTLIAMSRWPRLMACAYDTAVLADRSGLLRWLPTTRSVVLTALPARPRYRRPRAHHRHGAPVVTVFLGCTARLDNSVTDAIRLLAACGYAVDIPPGQGCCGALARHAGAEALAARQERANLKAFASAQGPVLSLASGCSAALMQYAQRHAHRFPHGVTDSVPFLAAHLPQLPLKLRPLAQTIAVHEPCSLRHAVGGRGMTATLLQQIPGVRVLPITTGSGCCGAAGDYFLRQPRRAQALRTETWAAIDATAADLVVSANIGCRLHLGARLGGVAVRHPLTVVAGQLP